MSNGGKQSSGSRVILQIREAFMAFNKHAINDTVNTRWHNNNFDGYKDDLTVLLNVVRSLFLCVSRLKGFSWLNSWKRSIERWKGEFSYIWTCTNTGKEIKPGESKEYCLVNWKWGKKQYLRIHYTLFAE